MNSNTNNNIQTGRTGEELAADWLESKGFHILHRNWRFEHLEIDLVAVKNGWLHFIEVKTRNTLLFGLPEEGVNKSKIKRLMRAGAAYQFRNPGRTRIQYDIVSVLMLKGKAPEFFLIEDIYAF
jgi:putative endonuclease